MGSGNHLFDPNSNPQTAHYWQRRDFVKSVAALAGAAGLSAYDMRSAAAEPPAETTKIRFVHAPAICLAPQYLAEQLLRLEGFTEVEYVEMQATPHGMAWGPGAVATGQADMTMWDTPSIVTSLDLTN